MSAPDKDDIYDEPTVPDALECPHCKSIIPPYGSKCPACEKEFEWGQARQIYWSRELTEVSGDVATTSTASKALIGKIKDDFKELASSFTVRQKEFVEQRNFSRKLDDLEDKMVTFGDQADKIEAFVKEIQETVENIDKKTEEKTWKEKIVENVTDNIIGYIIVGILGIILTLIGLR